MSCIKYLERHLPTMSPCYYLTGSGSRKSEKEAAILLAKENEESFCLEATLKNGSAETG